MQRFAIPPPETSNTSVVANSPRRGIVASSAATPSREMERPRPKRSNAAGLQSCWIPGAR